MRITDKKDKRKMQEISIIADFTYMVFEKLW